jgi:glyoxylase-like metal-dependent hydrolase (beta-lactamase superfamily II)
LCHDEVVTYARWEIGDITVTRVTESVVSIPPALLFRDFPVAEGLAAQAWWSSPDFVTRAGDLVLSVHAFAVKTPRHKAVIDTCVGAAHVAGGWEFMRVDVPFLDRLAAAGFPRDDIDFVVCTHMHYDHVGWNVIVVDGERVPAFPNARYVFCRDEWEHASGRSGDLQTRTIDDHVRPIFDAGLADVVPSDHQVAPGVRLELTPGHTPGHVTVHLESNGAHAFVTGDLTHSPVQWSYPDWPGPDSDVAQASQTRRRLLARYANTSTLVLGTHYPPPSCGHLVAEGDGHRFQPVPDCPLVSQEHSETTRS